MTSCTSSLKKENKTFLTNQNSLILDDENHFSNIRQLTFKGEKAEAHFSSDGGGIFSRPRRRYAL
tara:strand:- start:2524 stop:2718 length:195 start_codon:yes stop_codon:yes gene_type:complete